MNDITDKQIKEFYNSASWKWTRRAKLMRDPLCEACQMSEVITPANKVHHMRPIRLFWNDRFNMKFLLSLCWSCHSQMEAEIKEQEKTGGG